MDLDILLELTVGQVRELLARADADENLEYFWDNYVDEEALEKVGYYDDAEDENYEEDEEDLGDYDDEDDIVEEDEDEEDWDEDICEGGALENPEEEALAQSIADDINAGRYNYDVVYAVYPEHIVRRIEELA